MARAATTTDVFNAVAEPRRRQIIDLLGDRELPVTDLVRMLGLAQPQVSKHLRVLREVGAVDARDDGRRRLYRLNGQALKPIHDWVQNYERMWSGRFEVLDAVLDELKQEEGDGDGARRPDGDGNAPGQCGDPDHAGVCCSPPPGLPGVDHSRPGQAMVGR